MDTTCLSGVILLLAVMSAMGASEAEMMAASVTTVPPVTTTVAETTPVPMKESSNEVPADQRPFENTGQDPPTTATPLVALERPEETTTRPAFSAEGASSTDSGNAISNIDDNYKFNDININHDKGFSKQGQLGDEGSASTETSSNTPLHSAASNEDSVPASPTPVSTDSLAADVETGLPADPSGTVSSTPVIDTGDASVLPLSPSAIDPSAVTVEVDPSEISFPEAPRSGQALGTEHGSSGAGFYPGSVADSATEQQSTSEGTTTEYTGPRDTGSGISSHPIPSSNPTDNVATSPAEPDEAVSLVPWEVTPSGTSALYAADDVQGSASAGSLEGQHDPTVVATPADDVQRQDTASTPPSAGETASELTPLYGPSAVSPVQNAESQSQTTTGHTRLDLAPSEKTTEILQTGTDRGSSTTAPLGETATAPDAASGAVSTFVTQPKDVSETENPADGANANHQMQPTTTTASQLFEKSSPRKGDTPEATETTLLDTGSRLTTAESAVTTVLPWVNTAEMGRSNDPQGMAVSIDHAMETTTNSNTPAAAGAIGTSYGTGEEKTPKPEQETSALPSFVSSPETTTLSTSGSDSQVATTIENSDATTATTTEHAAIGSVDFSTPASPGNTPTTLFEVRGTAESAATAAPTTHSVEATTIVSSSIAASDTTTSEQPTMETLPSGADAQAGAVPPQEETTSSPQDGTEGTTIEDTTAPSYLSTQKVTRLFETTTTVQHIFSEQNSTESPGVAITEETARYPTQEPSGTSSPGEVQDTGTVESPAESTTQENTPAPTTEPSTEVTAANGLEITTSTQVPAEKQAETQTTAVPTTEELTEPPETFTTQPSFDVTGSVTSEEPSPTPRFLSPEGNQPPLEAETEAAELSSIGPVSDSGVHAASSASRSPKQLSESTPATISDGTTVPYSQHGFTTAPSLFAATQVHTTWPQPATYSVSIEEASSQGTTEREPWTTPVTTAATVQYTTTEGLVPATGLENVEEAAGSPIDAACEIMDGSLPVSCLQPEELNHIVTVKFADLNKTRAETFRTEARIWLQDYYKGKGMHMADPAVVFLSGDRGMDLISFFIVNRTRGSVIPSEDVVAVLNNMKVTFEDKLGTAITDVFYGLPVVHHKGVGVAGFLGSQLGLVYVIVGASLAALLLLALLVVIMVKCRTLSANQYSPDSEKLTKDLQMRAEMGDLRPGEDILKEEAQLKEALNGNGTHINGDGWVVPYSQIVSGHKSPADAQDTRL